MAMRSGCSRYASEAMRATIRMSSQPCMASMFMCLVHAPFVDGGLDAESCDVGGHVQADSRCGSPQFGRPIPQRGTLQARGLGGGCSATSHVLSRGACSVFRLFGSRARSRTRGSGQPVLSANSRWEATEESVFEISCYSLLSQKQTLRFALSDESAHLVLLHLFLEC